MEKIIRILGIGLSLISLYVSLGGVKSLAYLTFQSAILATIAIFLGFLNKSSSVRLRLLSLVWVLQVGVCLLYWSYLFPIKGFIKDPFSQIFLHGGLIPFLYNQIRNLEIKVDKITFTIISVFSIYYLLVLIISAKLGSPLYPGMAFDQPLSYFLTFIGLFLGQSLTFSLHLFTNKQKTN